MQREPSRNAKQPATAARYGSRERSLEQREIWRVERLLCYDGRSR